MSWGWICEPGWGQNRVFPSPSSHWLKYITVISRTSNIRTWENNSADSPRWPRHLINRLLKLPPQVLILQSKISNVQIIFMYNKQPKFLRVFFQSLDNNVLQYCSTKLVTDTQYETSFFHFNTKLKKSVHITNLYLWIQLVNSPFQLIMTQNS